MFEWDEAKNAANITKHGISFEQAVRFFEAPLLTAVDGRRDYGELREISIGRLDEAAILTVVHTDRSGRRRIISARPASGRERRQYEEAIRPADDLG